MFGSGPLRFRRPPLGGGPPRIACAFGDPSANEQSIRLLVDLVKKVEYSGVSGGLRLARSDSPTQSSPLHPVPSVLSQCATGSWPLLHPGRDDRTGPSFGGSRQGVSRLPPKTPTAIPRNGVLLCEKCGLSPLLSVEFEHFWCACLIFRVKRLNFAHVPTQKRAAILCERVCCF